MTFVSNEALERSLIAHMHPNRDIILCKVIDRCTLIEESDICLVIAIGAESYKSERERTVELQVKKGDYVLVPRKIRRITADITTDYFLVSVFDILSIWINMNQIE